MDVPESQEVAGERLDRAARALLERTAMAALHARTSPWLYVLCIGIPFLLGASMAVAGLYLLGALR